MFMKSTEKLKNKVLSSNPEKYKVFFRKLSFEEVKKLNNELVCLLKVFDKICRDNKLVYMLAAGGLIGAVRNGECLPWDDDIDLVMPRSDYEKIGTILKKNPDQYSNFIMKYPEDSTVITMAAHFYKKDNTIKNQIDNSIGESKIYEAFIYLDILPMDYCSDNHFADNLRGHLINITQLGFVSRRCFKRNDPFINYLAKDSRELQNNLLMRKIFSLPFLLIPKKVLFSFLRLCAYKKESSHVTIAYGALRYFGEKTETAIWFPVKEIDFCGLKVMAPNRPEAYLENRYGDYKTVPTQSEQEERMIRLKGEWKKLVK